MTIVDVEKAYNNLGVVHNCIFSDFKACSVDKSQKPYHYVVSNLTSCINFDSVKNVIHSTQKYSVDSLFISKKINALYFIEFKNSSFCVSRHKIIRKAFCSINIHNEICAFPNYLFCKNVLCLVLSTDKENDRLTKEGGLIGAMLRVAHYTINESYKKELNDRFRDIIISKSDPSLYFQFDDCMVIFDNDFDTFISMLR